MDGGRAGRSIAALGSRATKVSRFAVWDEETDEDQEIERWRARSIRRLRRR
jgi:hypothetical protein